MVKEIDKGLIMMIFGFTNMTYSIRTKKVEIQMIQLQKQLLY